jgi:hypothetical protein
MLQAHFHLTIVDASRAFDVCTTRLKKVCRQYGIKRWPHRQIQCSLKSGRHTMDDINRMGIAERAKFNMALLPSKPRALYIGANPLEQQQNDSPLQGGQDVGMPNVEPVKAVQPPIYSMPTHQHMLAPVAGSAALAQTNTAANVGNTGPYSAMQLAMLGSGQTNLASVQNASFLLQSQLQSHQMQSQMRSQPRYQPQPMADQYQQHLQHHHQPQAAQPTPDPAANPPTNNASTPSPTSQSMPSGADETSIQAAALLANFENRASEAQAQQVEAQVRALLQAHAKSKSQAQCGPGPAGQAQTGTPLGTPAAQVRAW